MVRTACTVGNCMSLSRLDKNLKFHQFPHAEERGWDCSHTSRTPLRAAAVARHDQDGAFVNFVHSFYSEHFIEHYSQAHRTEVMIRKTFYEFNQVRLIEEVKKRPGLYRKEQPAEREEKLQLWKEVGAAMYSDWDTFNKSAANYRVLQLQKKWRSLRDAYNRELRARRAAQRANRRVYIYFKRMSFLGGFEGSLNDDDNEDGNQLTHTNQTEDPLNSSTTQNPKKRRKSSSESNNPPEGMEMQVFPEDVADDDSDKLFLLSLLPAIKKLPLYIKMWMRAQIAKVLQEAVIPHYSKSVLINRNYIL